MKGPYLFIAFACQSIPPDRKVSIDSLLSRLTIEGKAEKMFPLKITFRVFLGFIAGECKEKVRIYIEVISPSNEKLSRFPCDVEFQDTPNHQVLINVLIEDFVIQEPGIYWLDVKLNQALVTRIPTEVVYHQAQLVSGE